MYQTAFGALEVLERKGVRNATKSQRSIRQKGLCRHCHCESTISMSPVDVMKRNPYPCRSNSFSLVPGTWPEAHFSTPRRESKAIFASRARLPQHRAEQMCRNR